jgi:hypothetical protein
MRLLAWIGIAMIVCWGVLWLGIKLAVGAVHALLVLGLVLVVVGFLRRGAAKT